VWKLKGCRRGEKKEWSGEVEDGVRITSKRVDISSWRMEAICKKQKSFFSKKIFPKKIVTCSNTNCLKDFANYIFKCKDKSEGLVKRMDFYLLIIIM
jgi:hypothetical protein